MAGGAGTGREDPGAGGGWAALCRATGAGSPTSIDGCWGGADTQLGAAGFLTMRYFVP